MNSSDRKSINLLAQERPASYQKGRFHLTLEPMCGLCNRMRVLDSAVSLAAEKGGRVRVLWYSNFDINCRFDDIFEPLPPFIDIWNISLPYSVELLAKRLAYAIIKRSSDRVIFQHEAESLVDEGYDFSEISQRRRPFLKTWSRFYPSSRPFAVFRPVSKLQRMIDQQTAQFRSTVGIHIRRTDNAVAIRNSPTNSFIEKMRDEISVQPATRFFVATDDAEEEIRLQSLFPGRIQSYQKRTRSRNSVQGIEDAVIDLYALAHCRKVIGSHQSSFSETAAAIGASLPNRAA